MSYNQINTVIASVLYEPAHFIFQKKCQAMYDFTPQEEGELELKKGDMVTKDEEIDKHWWRGVNKRSGCKGLYPANYVKEA